MGDLPREADKGVLSLDFDRRLLLQFRDSTITSDGSNTAVASVNCFILQPICTNPPPRQHYTRIIAAGFCRGSLEQALIEAMVACLGHHEDRRNSAAQGQHRDHHAPLSSGRGGEPGAAALHPGHM
jgi:hypothetical protein